METKHTPGPWQYDFEGETAAFIVESDGTTVCELSVTENTTAHSALAGNCRLIAAAPELLHALRRLSHPMADDDDLDYAHKIIAKADGQY